MRRLKLFAGVLALICGAALSSGQPTAATGTPAAFELPSSLDIHDGMIADFAGTYYAYGTAYGCNFQWYVSSPWCGFKVSTAPSLSGPWSTPTTLVAPNQIDPANGQTFNQVAGTNGGHGAFNPRMLHRSDGVYVLWANVVDNRSSTTTSAYVVFGCNGPAGPCGTEAGAPHGSTHIPALHQCNGNNGDFAMGQDASGAVLVCSYGGVLSQERLDSWWANGSGSGSTSLGGLTSVEGPGVYQDPASGTWILSFSDPLCGYCSGSGTGYATASSLMGPWTAPANTSVVPSTTPVAGRRDLSATSCGGQPRTISVVDGQAWQGIDLWLGQRNETSAGVVYEPLSYTGAPTDSAGDGHVWTPPFAPWTCP